MTTTFTVCFANAEQEYVVKTFKTFGGARRFVTTHRHYYDYWRNCDQWAIERIMPRDQWGQTCVIAQSLNYSHKPRFRNRSEADKWEPAAKDTVRIPLADVAGKV